MQGDGPESLQANCADGLHVCVTPSQCFSSVSSMQSFSPSQRQRMGIHRPSKRHWNSSEWQPPGGRVAVKWTRRRVRTKEAWKGSLSRLEKNTVCGNTTDVFYYTPGTTKGPQHQWTSECVCACILMDKYWRILTLDRYMKQIQEALWCK